APSRREASHAEVPALFGPGCGWARSSCCRGAEGRDSAASGSGRRDPAQCDATRTARDLDRWRASGRGAAIAICRAMYLARSLALHVVLGAVATLAVATVGCTGQVTTIPDKGDDTRDAASPDA